MLRQHLFFFFTGWEKCWNLHFTPHQYRHRVLFSPHRWSVVWITACFSRTRVQNRRSQASLTYKHILNKTVRYIHLVLVAAYIAVVAAHISQVVVEYSILVYFLQLVIALVFAHPKSDLSCFRSIFASFNGADEQTRFCSCVLACLRLSHVGFFFPSVSLIKCLRLADWPQSVFVGFSGGG